MLSLVMLSLVMLSLVMLSLSKHEARSANRPWYGSDAC